MKAFSIIVVVVVLVVGGYFMIDKTKNLTGREKANALVVSFGKYIGINDAVLDSDNDRSFGEFGFHYDAEKNILTGRIYVRDAFLQDAPPEEIANTRKVYLALNDPKIGGMFEQGGGYFVVDEEKNTVFLVKDFLVDSTSPSELKKEMEYLVNLGATWSFHWLARVAGIVHGWDPVPTEMVTLENDKKGDIDS